MTNWRDYVLQHFTEPSHRLTLVADPDGLLLEEEFLAVIRTRGFDLLPLEDVVTFRYTYEANYRQRWDDNNPTNFVVILHSPQASLQALPFDLLQSGRQLHFSLPELFPKLSYPVVRALDPAYLQPLYEAYGTYQGPGLGDQATKVFILKHVFGVDPDLIKTTLDLLKLLLSRHTRAQRVPMILDEVLKAKFRNNPILAESPLTEFLSSATDFFVFLQAQWLNFLAAQQPPEVLAVGENRTAYTTETALPLADSTVQIYLNTLFLEGKLKPIPLPEDWQTAQEWTKIGIIHQPEVEQVQRFDHLLQQLKQTLPTTDSLNKDWLQFAQRWAELTVLRHRYVDNLTESARDAYAQFHLTVESQFADWLLDRYHTLHNQPFHNGPVMGHHIPGYLAAYRRQQRDKVRIALIVVDGLALDQWQIVRQVWHEQTQPWRIQESTLFTWIPTLTSIARQAIFAGQPPQLFPESWQTTDKEAQRWQTFWQGQSLPVTAVGYARNLGTNVVQLHHSDPTAPDVDTSLEPEALALIENPKMQAVGLVINTVDNISHGMQLGTAGMHQQVRLWMIQHHYLTRLVRKLLDENFTVFLTADHGNIWAQGIGRPNEGTLVETRGQRARIYTDPTFLDLARQQMPGALEWSNIGLPVGLQILLAPELNAFLNVGEQAVCHGGIALEEVIVPFVQITKNEAA